MSWSLSGLAADPDGGAPGTIAPAPPEAPPIAALPPDPAAVEVVPAEPPTIQALPLDAAPPEAAPLPQPSAAPIELDGYGLSGATHAERAPLEPERPQLDGIVMLSVADGVGAGGQLRRGMLGVRATLAYMPLKFIIDKDPNDMTFGSLQFAHSVQLNVDALLIGAESGKGASLGYRYNDLLGQGLSVAYQSVFEAWGQRFNLSFPISYFPGATSRVRERLDVRNNDKINFPFGAGFQFGAGIAWVL
jgi:hypothetical protein